MFQDLYQRLVSYVNEGQVALTYDNSLSSFYDDKEHWINISPTNVGELCELLNISSDEIYCLVLAHELGHALNHCEVGYKWGRDEVHAWGRGLELIKELGFEKPSAYEQVRQYCLETYDISA